MGSVEAEVVTLLKTWLEALRDSLSCIIIWLSVHAATSEAVMKEINQKKEWWQWSVVFVIFFLCLMHCSQYMIILLLVVFSFWWEQLLNIWDYITYKMIVCSIVCLCCIIVFLELRVESFWGVRHPIFW